MIINPYSFTTAGPPPAVYNEITVLQDLGQTANIQTYMRARAAGSRHGGTDVVLPDPTYATDELTTLAYNTWTLNECGYRVKRLTQHDSGLPTTGNNEALRSERMVTTVRDSNGKRLFWSKHKSNSIIVFELDTITRDCTYLKEVTITAITDTDQRVLIFPHPTEPDTVIYPVGTQIRKTNIRTASSFSTHTVIATLPYTVPDKWANNDGNCIGGTRILVGDGSNTSFFVFDIVTGLACRTTNGVSYSDVALASRTTFTFTDLDYAFLTHDGEYVLAVCRGTSGPDGGSGLYCYDLSFNYIGKVYGSTGHYTRNISTFTGSPKNTVMTKVTAGQTGDFSGAFATAEDIAISFTPSWDGSVWSLTRQAIRTRKWTYSNNNPAGGQMSGIPGIQNVFAKAEKTAYTSTTQIEANYVLGDFWGKEEIWINFTDQANHWRRLGKNLTRRNSPTNSQVEINILDVGADGTIYLVLYSYIGPAEGLTTNILSSKDMWLFVVPPVADDATVQSYM